MEGARIWNTIDGTVTCIAKYIVMAFPAGVFHPGDRERILGFLVAFPVALKRELRLETDLRELKSVLPAEDLARIQSAPSMSTYTLHVLSSYLLTAKAKAAEKKLPMTLIIVRCPRTIRRHATWSQYKVEILL